MKLFTPIRLIGAVLILIPLTGCVTSAPSAEPAPDWITDLPGDSSSYYIGISGSNTGSESDDREAAYSKALKNLAGAIMTEISSTTTVEESENSEGYKSSFESNIETSVAQNLSDVETVDTYYSKDRGYWFYLRLSKAAWARLVAERAAELQATVDDLFYDVFPDTLTELKVVERGTEAYARYYSGKPIKMELLGQKGSVDTILTLRAEKLLGELAIEWNPPSNKLTRGKPAPLEGRLVLKDSGSGVSYENPGAMTLALTDDEGRELRRFQTERDGRFSLDFAETERTGNINYTLAAVSPFEPSLLADQVAYRLPSLSRNFTVEAYVLPVKVESDWNNGDLANRTLAFLKEAGTLDVTPYEDGKGAEYLTVRFTFREAPPNDYGMIICYASLYLSRVTPGGEVTLIKTDEFKDGGLSADQARQRASEKLFSELGETEEFKTVMAEIE
ncbi:MAG: LPP20 family lipoprotein [Spirochaetales bacterium]|nr:LPP20 family lipoprotein [Spirochaetales bacterium]